MKKFAAITIAFISFILSLQVFAAGGGGGGGSGGSGGGTSCGEDIWECGAWSVCSASDQQTRACALVQDCDIVTTARPPEIQSCTSPTPVCTEDTWNCSDWSLCQSDGRQTRACHLANNCRTVETPRPQETQVCPGLLCGYLPTLAERIKCRLNLNQDELNREFSILYFPEYCKLEGSAAEQQECIALYRSFNTCWQMPFGKKRTRCGKKVSGLGNSPEGRERFTLFQMYEYSVRAENAYRKGEASLDATADLDVFIEQSKQKVEEAESPRVWRSLLRQVKKQFKNFSAGGAPFGRSIK